MPALLIAGIPPLAAMGTNKLQSSVGSFSATMSFARRGLIDWKNGIPILVMAFAGGFLGAISAGLLPQRLFYTLVPVLLIFVVLYFIFSPKLDTREKKALIPYSIFIFTITPLLGFYDGIFGPGTGSFLIVAFIVLMGCQLVPALSYTKLANFGSNIGALSFFLFKGYVFFPVGFAMALGAFIGANIGSRFAVKFGAKLIKPMIIMISLCMIVKLLTMAK